MKTEKILHELKDAQKHEDFASLNALIKKLEDEIINEKVKENTPAQKWTAIKKILKRSKSREILQKINTRDDYQEFTDSHIACILKNDDKIKNLDESFKSPDAVIYPDLVSLLQSVQKNLNDEIKISCKELKKLVKLNKEILSVQHLKFNKLYIDTMIKVLEFKNDDTITFKVTKNSIRPVTIENASGSTCIIMPLMCDEDKR